MHRYIEVGNLDSAAGKRALRKLLRESVKEMTKVGAVHKLDNATNPAR